LGNGAAAPRRRARRALHTAPANRASSASTPARYPTSLHPRPATSLGHAPSEAGRIPRPRASAPRASCQPDAPPFRPAVCPRPPARVRRTTTGNHAVVTSRPGQPLFKRRRHPAPSTRHPSRSPPLSPPLEVDFLSYRHLAKSASEKPRNTKEEDAEYQRPKSGV
jgi:hypothetical protein